MLCGLKVFHQPEPGVLLAEADHDLFEMRYRNLILATGARERFLPFPGWTLPNVMGAGGLQALVKSGLPIQGKRVVVAGTGPLLLAVASYLRKHGAEDARFYYQRGINAVIFGVGGNGLHGPAEYVDTTTIIPYYRALKEFLREPRGQEQASPNG